MGPAFSSCGDHCHHHWLEDFTAEAIFVKPPTDFASNRMAEQLVHHREAVRQEAANSKRNVVGLQNEDGPGPLAESLGPDDPGWPELQTLFAGCGISAGGVIAQSVRAGSMTT